MAVLILAVTEEPDISSSSGKMLRPTQEASSREIAPKPSPFSSHLVYTQAHFST